MKLVAKFITELQLTFLDKTQLASAIGFAEFCKSDQHANDFEPLIAAKAKANQKLHGGTAPGRKSTLPQNSGEVNPKSRETQRQLAKLSGLSHDTIAKQNAYAAI